MSRASTVVLLGLLLGSLMLPSTVSFHSGNGSASNNGCSCHASAENASTSVQISGVPSAYVANQTYLLNLTVSNPYMASGNGGFRMLNPIGTIVAAPGFEDSIQEMDDGQTQTANGSHQLSWEFLWTAPINGSGSVTFQAFALVANGDESLTGDTWSSISIDIDEGNGTNEQEPDDNSSDSADGMIPAVGFIPVIVTIISSAMIIRKFDS